MKTLTLVGANNLRPEWDELRRLEEADEYPRATYFNTELGTDLMDERYLAHAPSHRKAVYAKLPVAVQQLAETYWVRNRYDAVISWTEKLGMPLAGILKATRSTIPHVGIFSWISRPRQARWLQRTHSHFDAVILMSSVQRSFAIDTIGVPEQKVPLLRWPVDTRFWRALPVDGTMICAVGREMRDYDTFIDAVSATSIPAHIAANIVAGKNDPWIRTLTEAQNKYPTITVGKKNFRELRDLYARSRFLVMPVLPTDTDNGSTSILEAMAMGKPVICSRTAGQVDIIVEGKTGLYVPLNDPRAMRDAITYLWDNPEIARAMGREAQAYVQRYHPLELWVANVKSVVQSAIDRRRRGTRAHGMAGDCRPA
jgi:glycosyltransferase involved in cell wall biosynthesis